MNTIPRCSKHEVWRKEINFFGLTQRFELQHKQSLMCKGKLGEEKVFKILNSHLGFPNFTARLEQKNGRIRTGTNFPRPKILWLVWSQIREKLRMIFLKVFFPSEKEMFSVRWSSFQAECQGFSVYHLSWVFYVRFVGYCSSPCGKNKSLKFLDMRSANFRCSRNKWPVCLARVSNGR